MSERTNDWRWKSPEVCGRVITFSWRDRSGMGRFGGGWQWKIGLQGGSSTVLLSLIWFSITWRKTPKSRQTVHRETASRTGESHVAQAFRPAVEEVELRSVDDAPDLFDETTDRMKSC